MLYHAQVKENKKLNNDNVYSLIIDGDFVAEAGQFYLLSIDGTPSQLPRPLSVHDIGSGYIKFCYQINGCGTRKLSQLPAGNYISLRGPYGVDMVKNNAKSSGEAKRIALVSGGVGVAPFLLAAKRFNSEGASVDIFAGFRDETIPMGCYGEFCNKVTIVTESGRPIDDIVAVNKGLVTEYFDASLYDEVYTCGPHVMMEAVCAMCLGKAKAYALLEKKMACGVGVCRGCVVKTELGNKDICRQGPTLRGEEIIWHE